jgi:outer membrane protein assembly factor BamD
MNRPNGNGPKFLVAAVLAALASTCAVSPALCWSLEDLNPFGKSKYEMKVEPNIPADRLYNEGLSKLESKDYETAAKRFADVQRQFPFSQWARKSLLMEVYSNYLNGSFTETSASADRYLQLYPNTDESAYVNYLAGMSLIGQMPDVHRDQGQITRAIKYFQVILDKYPKSEYAPEARLKIQIGRDQLAGAEITVGRYYLKRHNYTAAINRFREVLFKFQNTREAEEALERLTEAYLAMGIVDEAETAAAVLGHNYPNSQWYQEAYDRLRKEGASPQEHEESWISKVFKKVSLS